MSLNGVIAFREARGGTSDMPGVWAVDLNMVSLRKLGIVMGPHALSAEKQYWLGWEKMEILRGERGEDVCLDNNRMRLGESIVDPPYV